MAGNGGLPSRPTCASGETLRGQYPRAPPPARSGRRLSEEGLPGFLPIHADNKFILCAFPRLSRGFPLGSGIFPVFPLLFRPRGAGRGCRRYGGRIFILGLQIYILWFILRKQPKISLSGRAGLRKAALRAEGGNFRGGPLLSGRLPRRSGQVFPCKIGKRERDERHESYQAQRHGGGL